MGVQEKYIGNLEFDNSNIRSTFLLQDVGQAYGNRAYEEREHWSLSQTPAQKKVKEQHHHQFNRILRRS